MDRSTPQHRIQGSDRGGLGNDQDVDATVHGPARCRGIGGQGALRSVADGRNTFRRKGLVGDQILAHGIGPLLGEQRVDLVGAGGIGMAFHDYPRIVEGADRLLHFAEQGIFLTSPKDQELLNCKEANQ